MIKYFVVVLMSLGLAGCASGPRPNLTSQNVIQPIDDYHGSHATDPRYNSAMRNAGGGGGGL
jgi:uncharacterized protein YcfL